MKANTKEGFMFYNTRPITMYMQEIDAWYHDDWQTQPHVVMWVGILIRSRF